MEGGKEIKSILKVKQDKLPLVSIVTAVYNGDIYLEETILSILNQTYKNIQYIIIDGNSTDKTIDIIKKYDSQIDYWISEPDNGMYDALVKGFAKVRGEICAYINCDDYYSNTAIDTVVKIFSNHPEIKWLKGLDVVYNSSSEIISTYLPAYFRRSFIRKGIYNRFLNSIQQESCFWRKELLESTNMVQLAKFKLAGDYYLWYSFSKKTDLFIVQSWLGGFRLHKNQLSKNKKLYLQEIESFVENIGVFDYILMFVDRVLLKINSNKVKKIFSKKKLLLFDEQLEDYNL